MVCSCSAYGCTNRQTTLKDSFTKIKFHRFPLQKPALLQKWVIAVRRKDWKPTKYSFLCSEHFTDSDYRTDSRVRLKDDAIPSIFNFSVQLQNGAKKQRVKIKPKMTNSKRNLSEPIVVHISNDSTKYFCSEQSEIISPADAGEMSCLSYKEIERRVEIKQKVMNNIQHADKYMVLYIKNNSINKDLLCAEQS